MKSERNKRIFALILLVVLFCLLFLGSNDQKDIESEESHIISLRQKIENETLTIMEQDYDTYIISGEGELNRSDLILLLSTLKRDTIDVVNLIIGDGIEEIRYNAINDFKYMETLKVGKDVKAIYNGAIRNCPALKYLFIPSGVKKIPVDFALNCGNCYIITDGNEIQLPEDMDIDDSRIVLGINSGNDLQNYLTEQKKIFRTFSSNQLFTTDSEAGSSPMILHPGFLQYGPYFSIEKGNYFIECKGNNLNEIGENDILLNYTGVDSSVVISDLKNSNECITYNLKAERDIENLELGIQNSAKFNIEIDSLNIYYDNVITIPSIISVWW